MSGRFKTVAVLMGGPSAERDVSLRSGAAVAKALRERGYQVRDTDVTDKALPLDAGVEAVFIALHGEFGEDGQAQTLLEQRGIPYTGSGPRSSEASFDKRLSKKIFARQGIPTPEYETIRAGRRRTLGLPVVVKPARQGSSIGVHRVFEEAEWGDAIRDAARYDSDVIVERYIEGHELTVGIVGEQPLPVVEICAPGDWYSYAAKYTQGKTEYRVPAPISKTATERCQRAAMDSFRALGCRGFARVDIRMTPTGEAYVLELNTIPGFTATSLLPKAAAEAGISFDELCDRILQTATCGAPERVADAE